MAKTTSRRSTEKAVDRTLAEVQRMTGELTEAVKEAKKKFDQMDGQTKKQIMVGLAGATAIIAGAVGLGMAKNKKKKD